MYVRIGLPGREYMCDGVSAKQQIYIICGKMPIVIDVCVCLCMCVC